MDKKKQNGTVATKFSMVLRPRTTTTRPEKVKEMAKGKKTAGSEMMWNVDSGKGEILRKRKVMADDRNAETAENIVKRVKALKKEAPLAIGSVKPKQYLLAKKEAPHTIQSPKPKKNVHAIGSAMVLRPRTPKAKEEMSVKVDEKTKGKMPVEVNKKTDGKKTVTTGKIEICNSVRTGTAAKRKLAADERNTEVAGSRVIKVEAVMKKNKMDKGATTGRTRAVKGDESRKKVVKKGSAKKGDESGKKAVMKTNKVKKSLLAKKKATFTIRLPNPKRKIPVKKRASLSIGSPKPKKNLPAEASKRITRKGGKPGLPLSKERAKDTPANNHRITQGFNNQETGTSKNNQLMKRKKSNIFVTGSVFPPEIIMEMLSWLPVKFFGTPMVVCKQWYALIQDRHFIEKHMRRNFSNTEPMVGQGYIKFYDCDGLRLEMNRSTLKYRIRNPVTKQCLELPDPHRGSHCIFFTYVPLTLNYKIISIYDDKNSIECCEVLSIGNDELSWRLLKMPTGDFLERNRNNISITLTDDVVHCVRVIASGDDMFEEVVSLDIGTEQFTVTNLPKGQYKSWEKVWPINFKGKLALVDIIGAELCILVLENYKKQKWRKKEPLVPLEIMKKLEVEHGTIFPYSVDQSETLWFWVKDARKPISYNIKTKYIRTKRSFGHSLVHLKGMQPE